jgi:leucyl/phenylalanyl-tRNA--protein transferase
LVHLVGHLISRGFRLLDTQFLTDHLASFGAREIDRADYRQRLAEALGGKADFYGVGGNGSGGGVTGAGAAVGAEEMAGAVTTDGAARVAAGAREAGGRTAVEATGMGGAFVLQLIAQAS